MQLFTEYVIDIIRNIPYGKVMTYGQIASLAGNPRSARQVSRILHTMSKKYNLPWHRVINSKGEIVIKDSELSITQRVLLESECVVVSNSGKIDLTIFKYTPDYTEY